MKSALSDCENALKQYPQAFPLELAIDQLKCLIEMENNSSRDLSSLEKINIGWIAARELDGFADKALIDKLHLISAEVKKLKVKESRNN